MALTFDAKTNFAYSVIATAPTPAASGTSLDVNVGDGAKFPAAPFNAVVWPAGVQPTTTNAEVVRVTAKASDTFTITRSQESSSARTIVVNDQIMVGPTAKSLTDIENSFQTAGQVTCPVGAVMLWMTASTPTGWLLCNGQAVSRATYSELFALWGTGYGLGDGVTTFNVPDLRQRMPIGAWGSLAVGGTTGSWDHTHGPGTLTVASHTHGPGTLAVANHTHGPGTLQVAGHTHGPGTLTVAAHTHGSGSLGADSASAPHTHSMQSHTHDFTTNDATGGDFNNAQGGITFTASLYTHEHTGTTGGPSVADTDSANATHSHSVSGTTDSTGPAVTGGTTAFTGPTLAGGVTDGTAPTVNAGVTAGTAPAVSTGVTASANPPVIAVNFIVRATSTI